MQNVLLVIHLIVAVALVATVLLQRSEGGALGIGGGPGGLMTARGAANLLTRTTAILAGCFFLTSLALTILASQTERGGSIMDKVTPATTAPATVPAVPDATSPLTGPAAAPKPANPEVPISE